MVKKKKYLLDTTVCVSLLRCKPGLAEIISERGIENCCISDITIAELTYGAVKSENPKHLEDIDKIKKLFKVLPSNQSYNEYAEIRWNLTKRGLAIADFDTLIAATTLHYNMILVSINLRHFERIDSLNTENWE